MTHDICEYVFRLENTLYDLQEARPDLIESVDSRRRNPADPAVLARATELGVDPDLVALCQDYNGVEIRWRSRDDEGRCNGRLHLLPLEEVIKSWQGYLYEDDDVPPGADIRYFHPLDLITSEAQCGIVIDPDSPDRSLYYNYSGEMDISRLDLDFRGYLTMALEARAFFYWPKVLLNIKNDEQSAELDNFRTHMPRIFPDFDHTRFVDTYQSLRLSRQ